MKSVDTRPLTPVRKCLSTGMPVEVVATPAGRFAQADFHSANHHFEKVLLSHARVYTFARVHLITGLEELALQHLTQALVSLDTSQSHIVSNAVQLIRYVYDCEEICSPEQPIRKLITHFVAINFTDMIDEDFKMLLSEGGPFVVDISSKVSRRLLASAASSGSLEKEIDMLEDRLKTLGEMVAGRDATIASLNAEVAEWSSWKRGISARAKGKR